MNRPAATDGEIAVLNLESARRRAWARFWQNPLWPGIAESVVHWERLTTQFFGDAQALERLEMLASRFALVGASDSAALIQAEVASMVHRFDDARSHLLRAALLGTPRADIERQSLAIDQACGVELEAVLAARRLLAAASGRLEDLVPLGAVLADLELFDEADAVYQHAIYSYQGTSPFPLAWACFQLGVLWGELVSAPDARRAVLWYEAAISYLPAYVKARVHLAEIQTSLGRIAEAEVALLPALSSSDPEVHWRLADILVAQDRLDEAETQLDAARLAFDALLERYPLAFADHAAEFFAASGNDAQRALALARANVMNRPTRRAMEQVRAIAAKT